MQSSLCQRSIFMSIEDHEKITSLLDTHSPSDSPERQLLQWKLDAAVQLKQDYLFHDVVSAQSTVNFLSLLDGLEYWVKLGFPGKEQGTVSLFSPIGAVLIGLSAGQEIHWCRKNGRKLGIRVIEVVQR